MRLQFSSYRRVACSNHAGVSFFIVILCLPIIRQAPAPRHVHRRICPLDRRAHRLFLNIHHGPLPGFTGSMGCRRRPCGPFDIAIPSFLNPCLRRNTTALRTVCLAYYYLKYKSDVLGLHRLLRISSVQRPSPLTLGPSDTLKLTFQIIEKEEGKGVHPHQTFLRFYDEVTGEEGIQPIRVTANGKAKFELVRSYSILLRPQ